MTDLIQNIGNSVSELPSDVLLGHIVLTTITNANQDRGEIINRFKQLDLNTEHIPALGGSVDSFKRAIGNNKEYEYDISPTHRVRISIRPASPANISEVIEHPLLREVIVKNQPRREYDMVGIISLYRPPRDPHTARIDETGARISIQIRKQLSEIDIEQITNLAMQIRSEYDARRSALDSNRVRRLVRNFMREELQAIPLKQAVYFVPIGHREKLEKFATAISELEGCVIDTIPMLNLKEQREQVEGAFEEHSLEQLKDLTGYVKVRLEKNKVRPSEYATAVKDFNLIFNQIDHYQNSLGLPLENIKSTADVASAHFAALSDLYRKGN